MIDEGAARAYTHPDNPLRKSIVAPAAYGRTNTKNNTPAVVHIEMVEGENIEVRVAAKGGGSENKSKMAMLTPADSIVEWIKKTSR